MAKFKNLGASQISCKGLGVNKKSQFIYSITAESSSRDSATTRTGYRSGTSIQGKPRIYKKGGKNLWDVLYMCSMNAIKTNAACKAFYERLRANGKQENKA